MYPDYICFSFQKCVFFLKGAYQTEHSTVHHSNGLESSSLSLKFVVREHHFRGGNMKLKCTATISRVYTMSNEELVFRQQNSGLHIMENMSRVRNESTKSSSTDILLQLFTVYFLLKTFFEISSHILRTTRHDNLPA
ncbi:ig-like domain-containing protein [Nephila pilipes]|uniref:Ig-like domain-containing protein n=1 Tax=Nephila pilipes TaxID=299642 RepID=A0A8X6N904_NEPPI|nr:ig-like domain-containing protein [Nephila pilipes]